MIAALAELAGVAAISAGDPGAQVGHKVTSQPVGEAAPLAHLLEGGGGGGGQAEK